MRKSIYENFKSKRYIGNCFLYEVKNKKRQGRTAYIVEILRSAGKLPTTLRGCNQTRHSFFDFYHKKRLTNKNKFIIKKRNPLEKRITKKEMNEIKEEFKFIFD